MTGDAPDTIDAKAGGPTRHPPNDLLLEDLKHFGESLWRNDEIGEKRFNFFLTLVTAVIAGLVTLHTAQGELTGLDLLKRFLPEASKAGDLKALITSAGLWALFGIGVATYIRLLLRNRVTEEYHRTLAYIRERLLRLNPTTLFEEYDVPQKFDPSTIDWLWKGLKGGLAGTSGAMTAALLFAALVMSSVSSWLAGFIAIAVGAAFWFFAIRWKGDKRPEQYFRAGVGAVILDSQRRVLVLKRRKATDAHWQLPQGGLKVGEDPKSAMLREICEETAIDASKLKFREEYPQPLAYELPPEAQSRKTGMGQVHQWFVFEFSGTDADIRLGRFGEFRDKDWIPVRELENRAVSFRKKVYAHLAAFVANLPPHAPDRI
jgi:putative (di)nucleoside polyphosphate hydrolase